MPRARRPHAPRMPVVPRGARHATHQRQRHRRRTAGRRHPDAVRRRSLCRAVFDRRFLIEEGFDATKREIVELIERVLGARRPASRYELRDLMVVHPTRTPDDSPVIAALEQSIGSVLGRKARARRQPRHLRSQAHRADCRRSALRRVRAGRARTRAPARRILPHRRHRECDEGACARDTRPDGRTEIDSKDEEDDVRDGPRPGRWGLFVRAEVGASGDGARRDAEPANRPAAGA